MADQAAGLRSLFARRRPSLLIVAGCDPRKGAAAAHFGREAAATGRATVLVDGTAGEAATACAVRCRFELAHVLAGDRALSDVLRVLSPNLLLLPAARALSRYGALSSDEEARLTQAFAAGIGEAFTDAGTSDPQVDLIVVNAEAGRAVQALDAFGRDARVVVVVSDRTASLRGAYAEIKTMVSERNIENFEIVVPAVAARDSGRVAFNNLANTARRFLDIELVDGGSIGLDRGDGFRARAATDAPYVPAPGPVPSADHTPISRQEAPHAAIA